MTDALPDCVKNDMVVKQIYTNVWRRKMNQIILVNGLPRTGKSELCLKLAESLDPDFSIDKVAWKYKDILTLVKDSKRVGEVLMWDEAGIAEWGANARLFWSEGNLSASTLFQTMGFKRNIVLINLPMKIMLDKHVRSLVHVVIDTLNVDYARKMCRSKVFFLEQSGQKKEALSKYPRFTVNGARYKIKSKMWGRASKELVAAYITKSAAVKQMLQEKLVFDAISQERSITTKSKTFDSIYNDILENLEDYWNVDKEKVDSGLIQLKEGIGQNFAQKLASVINSEYKKGNISL